MVKTAMEKATQHEYIVQNEHGLNMEVIAHSVDDPIGTAVIHHGYVGSTNSPTIQLMRKTFNALGLNTVTPNTTHNYNNSDGDYREMTLEGHIEDLISCIQHTTHDTTFKGPLVIAGHSAGGYSALLTSAALSGSFSTSPTLTIASAPLISGRRYMDAWKEVIQAQGIPADRFMKQWEEKGFIPCGSDSGPDQLELHWSVMQNWCEHDLTDLNIALSNPTVLIGGDIDPFIRRNDIVDYFEASANPLIEARFIPEGDHCYEGQEDAFVKCLQSSVAEHFPQARL